MSSILRIVCAVGILVAVTASAPAGAQLCGNGSTEGDEQCDDGNSFGGDGCASNCTQEDRRVCSFAIGDTLLRPYNVTGAFFGAFSLAGSQILSTGRPRGASSEIPVVVRTADFNVAPLPLLGLRSCVCVRANTSPELGPGNTAAGSIGCAEQGLAQVDYLSTIDHNTHRNDPDPDPACAQGAIEPQGAPHPGACNGALRTSFSAGGPGGSTVMMYNLSFYFIANSSCEELAPGAAGREVGADGRPCTADDPGATASIPLIATSGTPAARIDHANNSAAFAIDRQFTTGQPIDCARFSTEPESGLLGTRLSGFTLSLDDLNAGDLIYELVMACGEPLPTATPSVTPVVIATPILSATPAGATPSQTIGAGGCAGDCDGNGTVSISELIRSVNIALDSLAIDVCQAVDGDGNGRVSVNELVRAVGNALRGCI